MKITYVYHSCYTIELNDVVLIFDYYKGQLPKIDVNKKVYFFVSHSHYDHYNEDIFDMYPDNDCEYILSSDCFAIENEKIHTALIDDFLEINDIKIKTYRSTDLGVAYLVNVHGLNIFHAGDLNAWCFEENDDEYNNAMISLYENEISKIKNECIDVAFIPFDSRLKSHARLGLELFLKYNNPELIFPMHINGTYDYIKEYILENKDTTHLQPVFGENFVFIR